MSFKRASRDGVRSRNAAADDRARTKTEGRRACVIFSRLACQRGPRHDHDSDRRHVLCFLHSKDRAGLALVPGVKGASVNLATEKAAVEYRPTVTSPAQIEEAIRGLGYTLLVPAAQGVSLAPTLSLEGKGINLNERQRAAYRKLQLRFWVARP